MKYSGSDLIINFFNVFVLEYQGYLFLDFIQKIFLIYIFYYYKKKNYYFNCNDLQNNFYDEKIPFIIIINHVQNIYQQFWI
jgi:hypothetical protein